ncbi:hypothetical protein CARUB_v10007243mg, partial [Capsella rubella]
SSPSQLYGTFTWKVKKFAQINEREIHSNVYEIGGHRWYLLIYPRGYDVNNHVSVFLCVANKDKLLPGWSHLAMFTVSVENKDPKKSKSSEFIELPKLQDGFIDKSGDLVFKAQVQVISLCAFWIKMKPNSRLEMSQEKMDVILKLVLEHFFIKNQVVSTLVMEFLFYGLKSLEERRENLERLAKAVARELASSNQIESAMKNLEDISKERTNDDNELSWMNLEDETKNEGTSDAKIFPASIAYVEKDMFIVEDPMLLLKRLALAQFRSVGTQNDLEHYEQPSLADLHRLVFELRSVGTQNALEQDEKQLADLGRWALGVFVLDHIFCTKIEFAYKEAIALERQQELIEEEERKENKGKKCFAGKKKRMN